MVMQRKDVKFTIHMSNRNHRLLKMFSVQRNTSMKRLINSAVEELLDKEGIDLSDNNPWRKAQQQRELFEGVIS